MNSRCSLGFTTNDPAVGFMHATYLQKCIAASQQLSRVMSCFKQPKGAVKQVCLTATATNNRMIKPATLATQQDPIDPKRDYDFLVLAGTSIYSAFACTQALGCG